MTNQVYNIIIDEDNVQILKNAVIIYEVSSKVKTVNLADLYNKMSVDINDEYSVVNGLKKIESPQNDSERVFNNIYDFINGLLFSLNKKLKELREKQSSTMF